MEAVLENFMTIEKMVDAIVFDKTGVMFRDRTTEAAEAGTYQGLLQRHFSGPI